MDKFELVEKWQQHCSAVGHITQAEALEQGKRPNPKKHATFTFSLSGKVIYCNLRGCDWSLRTD
jgi:hypothetical protein